MSRLMKTHTLATLATIVAIACGTASPALAQDEKGLGSILARVHGTFVDATGGLGVLSGDLTIVSFEVRNGAVTAIGRIDGALADSQGNMLGKVRQELALPVEHAASTCNQLRMELAGADAEVLSTLIHFDKEVAGYDSRGMDGTTPKALKVLCNAETVLRGKPTPDAVASALNEIAKNLARP
jgi:hypothetical protein